MHWNITQVAAYMPIRKHFFSYFYDYIIVNSMKKASIAVRYLFQKKMSIFM